MVGFAETLSHLTEQEMAWVMDPREGIVTRCQYLPTAADVFELIRDRKAKAEQFMPAPTAWKRIEDDADAPWNRERDFERKKRVVAMQLGYNPDERKAPQRTVNANLVPPTQEDLDNLKLKTPPGKPTRQLLNLLAEHG